MAARLSDSLVSTFESLEPRRLLAATLDQGVLVIIGTHLDDKIDLSFGGAPDKIRVALNGVLTRFTFNDVQQINLQAGQGDDVVHIDNGKVKLTTPTRVYGSGGDDTITTGRGPDRIYGGTGDDSIKSGNARDVIYGESGFDTLNGQDGFDVLDGGNNDDTLTGGAGVDRLSGGRGDDRFQIGDGEVDSGDGGLGNDSANADDLLDDLISVEIT